MNVEQLAQWELAVETEVLVQNLLQCYFSTTNPMRLSFGSIPVHHGGKPATNHLGYGTALRYFVLSSRQSVLQIFRTTDPNCLSKQLFIYETFFI
jgi:hypothetical protein